MNRFLLIVFTLLSSVGVWGGVVTSVKTSTSSTKYYYTLNCNSAGEHTTSKYISISGSTINGQSASGSYFEFVDTGTEGRYYIKNVATGKYLEPNTDNSTITLEDSPTNYWTINTHNEGDANSVLILANGENSKRLNNNTTSDIDIKPKLAGAGATGGCSHWTLTEHEFSNPVFTPATNKGYKLKMQGTEFYIKFRISGYDETNAVNATILSTEGTIFKIEQSGDGFTLKYQNEYMKTTGLYSWNSGHGTDEANSKWYFEPVEGENDTYFIKKVNDASGSIFFGNVNSSTEGTNLYTNQSSGNIKWVLEEMNLYPETSTSSTPKYYSIRNTRNNKYAKYAGDSQMMGQVSDRRESTANAFWFEAVNEDGLEEGVIAVKIHNAAAGKCVTSPSSFTDNGVTWYIKPNVYTGTASVAINRNATTWNNNDYGWNDYQGKGNNISTYASTDIGSAWWIEPLTDGDYSVMSNIKPYINNAGNGYYQISSDNASTLSNLINTASAGGITTDEYNSIKGNMSIKKPSTGYYLMKSYYDTYMDNETGTLKSTKSTSDVTTIVRLERQGTTDTYKISIQGTYLNTPTQSEDVTYGSDRATFTAVNTPNTVGKVAFDAGGTYGSLHTSSSQDYHVVGWTVDAGASQWTIEDATSIDVSLSAVGDASYATLYVDFPVAIPSDNNYTAIYTLSESNGEYTMNKQTSVPAKTGIILRDINEAARVTLEIPSSPGNATSALTGSLLASTAGDNCYIFGNGEEGLGFYPYAKGSSLAANKAYLVTSNAIRGFALNFDDVDTGIVSGQSDNIQLGNCYDLQGRRIAKPQRGLYIIGGKKVLF